MSNTTNIRLQRRIALTLIACGGLAAMAGCCTRSNGQARYWSRPGPAYATTGSSRSQQYAQPEYQTESQGQYQQAQQFEATAESTNIVIPLYQETLNVGKREVEAGSVRLRKIVRTETVNQPVELRHEEVVIDREPAGGATSTQANQALNQQFQEAETVIRLQREVPVIEKQVQPTGRIVVQTRMSGQQTNVQSQIRREDIDIAKQGNAKNVIISENVRAYSGSATGAAGESGGQTSGRDASTPSQPADNTRPEKQQQQGQEQP